MLRRHRVGNGMSMRMAIIEGGDAALKRGALLLVVGLLISPIRGAATEPAR